jgi:hypothetical protein
MLKLNDYEMRREQYINSIIFFIKNTKIPNIIFCDNSDSNVERSLFDIARKHGKNFEWLSFKGDEQAAVKFGKGYGEGEIIEYVLKNSEILQTCDYIIKITGRMIVKNINLIVSVANSSRVYMYPIVYNEDTPFLTTKMFMMPKKIYMRYFQKAYLGVRDMQHIYLETMFAKTVMENKLVTSLFVVAPDFYGYSGTSGQMINNSLIKKVKNTLWLYRMAKEAHRRENKK